jgi:GTP diphosphokinase / guanosine-3',5'-bis(diphosphate) 3'-diphosphatase
MLTQTEEEIKLVNQQFEEMLDCCARCKNPEDIALIRKAFAIASEAHKHVRRKSGEPYILHPIAVARIVAQDIGLGTKSIIASLLHDVVEDTDYSLEEIRHNFGDKITSIIDGLTKISDIFDKNSNLQAENFRKLLLTLSDDIRVILIKLADRLDNMRTLEALGENKRIKIAGETLYLFAPLAHRLGLYGIKTELEDLSLKYQHPQSYEEIVQKLKESEKKRLLFINKFSLPIIQKLEEHKIHFDISGRPKSIYSIWNKMQNKNVPFEEIFDLFAIRIVFDPNPSVPEKIQCWHIYSLITDIYMPKPDRIRDWVSTPKANGYEALHGTVMGPNGKWVEVQIRTARMEEIAEKGYAAHWKYKGLNNQESEVEKWLKRIKEMLENPNTNAIEFIDEFKLNLFSAEIFVFTPKGDIITLPKNATALDFAFEIHSEVGNKAIGAKVNHKLVPLSHILHSGDQVEILTSDTNRSQREWLNYVVTAKAKTALKDSFKDETRWRIEQGMKILEDKLKELNLHPNSRILKKLIAGYEVNNKEELYSQIGGEIILLDNIKKVLRKNTKSKLIRYWELTFGGSKKKNISNSEDEEESENTFDFKKPLIIREEIDKPEQSYKIAKCCNPIPGDDVIGYKSPNETILIHKSKCPAAIKLMSNHGNMIVSANWTAHKIVSFLARISFNGIDKVGIVNSITNIISHDLNANIRKIIVESHDGIFEGTIDLYVHDTKHLNNLIFNISKIKGINSIQRVEISED